MLNKAPVVLEINHVTKEFPLKNGQILKACDDINLQLHEGETLAIVGESGSGKSTLMKVIMKLLEPEAGSIILKGLDILNLKGEEARQARKHVQMVFQDPMTAFNPRMKVVDIITEPLTNFKKVSKEECRAIAKEYLELVELSEAFLDRHPHEMSGGQRQRVGIARALVLNPEVVICDEATSALDMSVQDTVAKLLVRIQQEKKVSYLFVCHDIALAQSISHRMAIMHRGQVVEVLDSTKLLESTHPYTTKLLSAVYNIDDYR